jgi:hypothetical protein
MTGAGDSSACVHTINPGRYYQAEGTKKNR